MMDETDPAAPCPMSDDDGIGRLIIHNRLDIERVVRAWVDEGVSPSYHAMRLRKIRLDWPELGQALDKLADNERVTALSVTEHYRPECDMTPDLPT